MKVSLGAQALLVAALASALVACTSDGSDGANGRNGADGSDGEEGRSALIAVRPEPPGSNCASGGSRIDAGQDANGDGALEPNEIGGTQYVCNGSGTGTASLVALADEPAGSNCVEGGKKFTAGQDSNGNGILDVSEVTSTGYACHGDDGASGALVAVVSEPAGTNCANGGVRVTSGPDTNSNGTLDPSEITSTQYVCSGGSTLVSTMSEPAGLNCQYGGTRIHAGLDGDGNGTLETSEVTATAFACNGAPGAGITWTEVTSDAVQTVAGMGYLVRNDAQQVVLTLPAAPAVGSIVQISGLGLGGWRIAQNAGQTIATGSLPGGRWGANWAPREFSASRYAVSSSADGTRLITALFPGRVYTSWDSGQSWTPNLLDGHWAGAAIAADGTRAVAAAYLGAVYILNASVSATQWTEVTSLPGPTLWRGLACSSDCRTIVAVPSGGPLYTSNDYGTTWTPSLQQGLWISAAASADGSRLIAAIEQNGHVYTSSDYGATWVARLEMTGWNSVASSADGMRLAAASNGTLGIAPRLYLSKDGGETWTIAGPQRWHAVASSADGTRLAAASSDDSRVHFSTDSGATWTPQGPAMGVWTSLSATADGTRVLGVTTGSEIMSFSPARASSTTLGTAGSISGGQHDAIALQYTGGGKFIVLSHGGTFAVQ